MQNVKYRWSEISSLLQAKIGSCGLSHMQLKNAVNIDYHAIHRFAKRGIKNSSTNAIILCEHFKIDINKYANMQIIDKSDIERTIEDVWDGTPSHADLIIELIKSTKKFRIDQR